MRISDPAESTEPIIGPWRSLPPRQATGKPTWHYCYITRYVGWGKPERHGCRRGYHVSRRTQGIDSNGHRVWTSGSADASKCAEKTARALNKAGC